MDTDISHSDHGPIYEYAPLDPAKNLIRLLRLTQEAPTPARSKRQSIRDRSLSPPPIRCALETYELEQCPTYTAISYTWGPPQPTNTICIDGKTMLVRENLHALLSVLRHKDYTFLSEDEYRETDLIDNHFWVDAICINQDDLQERGHQVGLMAQIYTRAACAISWLGPEYEDSPVAISALRTGDIRTTTEIEVDDRLFLQSSVEDVQTVQASIAALFRRPYWRRVWVVQEFTLPQNLLLLCGTHGVWWENLQEIVSRGPFELEFLKIRDEKDPLTSWWILGDARSYAQGGVQSGDAVLRAQTLDQLLEVFHQSECSDVRDRVYALLSLVTEHPTMPTTNKAVDPLLADYMVSPVTLYHRVLAYHRYASTLGNRTAWTRFRTVLADALNIDRKDRVRDGFRGSPEDDKAAIQDTSTHGGSIDHSP